MNNYKKIQTHSLNRVSYIKVYKHNILHKNDGHIPLVDFFFIFLCCCKWYN